MQLFQKLKTLVFEERYVIGQHASMEKSTKPKRLPNLCYSLFVLKPV